MATNIIYMHTSQNTPQLSLDKNQSKAPTTLIDTLESILNLNSICRALEKLKQKLKYQNQNLLAKKAQQNEIK